MEIKESVLEQINEKLCRHIDRIKDGLSSNSLQPQDIPLEDICSVIFTHYVSVDEFIDTTTTFHDSISSLLTLLESEMNKNNASLCISLLTILSQSLCSYVLLEKKSQIQNELFSIRLSREMYSHEQFDLYTLKSQKESDSAFTGKGVIYTAITGGYDNLHTPSYIDPNLDYICFTDNSSLESDIWEIRYIDNPDHLDNIRLARRHKILCTEYVGDYDYSVWIDGKINIIGDIKETIRRYHRNSPLLCFPHYERDCIYDEALACKELKRGNTVEIDKQISKYRKENYPAHNGLIDSCVLIRSHHSDKLNELLCTWWQEVLTESTRDQLSFNYACHKTGFQYDLCNLDVYNNPFTTTESHN